MPPELPALYGARTRLIDANNQEIGQSPLFTKPPSFGNALVQNIAGLTEVSGVVEMQHYNIQIKKENLKLSLQNLQQKEAEFARELEEKYGQGQISLETGEFLPNE